MHETAGHKSRLWIFDQVSSGAAERKQDTNARSRSGGRRFHRDALNHNLSISPDCLISSNLESSDIVGPHNFRGGPFGKVFKRLGERPRGRLVGEDGAVV